MKRCPLAVSLSVAHPPRRHHKGWSGSTCCGVGQDMAPKALAATVLLLRKQDYNLQSHRKASKTTAWGVTGVCFLKLTSKFGGRGVIDFVQFEFINPNDRDKTSKNKLFKQLVDQGLKPTNLEILTKLAKQGRTSIALLWLKQLEANSFIALLETLSFNWGFSSSISLDVFIIPSLFFAITPPIISKALYSTSA